MTMLISLPALSLKLEKHLAALEAAGVTEDDGECLEDKAMHLAVEEMYEETGRKFRPWAANGKATRLGEYVLIVDSDTIVPEVSTPCFLCVSAGLTKVGLPAGRGARADGVPHGRNSAARIGRHAGCAPLL